MLWDTWFGSPWLVDGGLGWPGMGRKLLQMLDESSLLFEVAGWPYVARRIGESLCPSGLVRSP